MISTSRTWKGCSAPVATSSHRGYSAITSLVSTSPSPITSPTPPPITLLSSCTPWLCLFFLLQFVHCRLSPNILISSLSHMKKRLKSKNMIASVRACLVYLARFVGIVNFPSLINWGISEMEKSKDIFCNFLHNPSFYLSPYQYSNLNKRWHFSKPNLTKSKYIEAKSLNLIDI